MKILMLVSYKLGEKTFNRGELYHTDYMTARLLVKKRAALSISSEATSIPDKNFHNKMLKIRYEEN